MLGDQLYVAREGLPPGLVNRFVRLAAFQNPAFYAAQAMRRSTFGTPRIVACAELLSHHVALPRGCLEATEGLLEELGIGLDLRDDASRGASGRHKAFLGELTPEQAVAADALLAERHGRARGHYRVRQDGGRGVAARHPGNQHAHPGSPPPAHGPVDRTARRVPRSAHCAIGKISGRGRKPTGVVDVAVIQSLVHGDEVDDIVAEYGHLIVDECHHLSAPSFEKVARRAKVKYVLGLSATVTRQDGHHPIVFMQCGPVRFRASAKSQARQRPFAHRALLRLTAFRLPEGIETERPPIQHVYGRSPRTWRADDMIFDDVLSALEAGRSPLVLTARKDPRPAPCRAARPVRA